jgi:DNA repair exonuclease SbcCD ATPase subunit
MAFTRKYLAALGIEPDKVDEIITAHSEVVEGLKSEISKLKTNDEELSKVKEQLTQAKNSLKETTEKLTAAEKERDDYKSKSETSAAEFEKLKTETAAKETAAKRETALRNELKAKKYSDEAVSIIFDSKKDYAGRIEFGEDGNATNIADILDEIEAGYPQYKPKTSTSGANPATPPANGGGKPAITKDEIMAIKNTAERQKKIAENPDLFGIK